MSRNPYGQYLLKLVDHGHGADPLRMRVIDTPLPGVLVLEPRVFRDARGFFLETYREDRLAEVGITDRFVQANQSRSVRDTLRGLHWQWRRPQAKLVRVVTGSIFDAVVDVRRDSPTFGKWCGVELSADNFQQLYVPAGFAHGFCVTSEDGRRRVPVQRLLRPWRRGGSALERSRNWDRLANALAAAVREGCA